MVDKLGDVMINIDVFTTFFKSFQISKFRLEYNSKFGDGFNETMDRSNFYLLTSKSKKIGLRINNELVLVKAFVKSIVKNTKTNVTSVLD